MTDLAELLRLHDRETATFRKADAALCQLRADLQTAEAWRDECKANMDRAWDEAQDVLNRMAACRARDEARSAPVPSSTP